MPTSSTERLSAPFSPSQVERLGWATPMYRGALERVCSAQATPRQAIKAMCLACIGYEREQITNCTDLGCPLWHHRPYQTAGGDPC